MKIAYMRNNKFKHTPKSAIRISLEEETMEKLINFAASLGISKSKVIEEALTEYLARVKKVQALYPPPNI